MIVKLLTRHHLEFLSLKGGCRGSSESTLVKMTLSEFLKYGQSFSDHAKLQAKMNQCQLFCRFHCTHAKDSKKSMLGRTSMFFHAPN